MKYITALSSRGRRLLAFLMLGGAIWLTVSLIIIPLLETQTGLSEDILNARQRLGRLDSIIARAEASRSGLETGSTVKTWEGASTSVISADIQGLAKNLAQTHGISILSASQTENSFGEGVETVGLVLEGHGEIAAFVDLFTALETHQPILFIDNLIFRPFQSATGSKTGERLPLSARFEIHAPHQLGAGK